MKFKLLILILSKIDMMPDILSRFMQEGISGTTIMDCEGMLKIISSSNIEPPPIFGSLRQFLNPERPKGKILLTVIPEEKVETAKSAIEDIMGGLDRPDTGICFTIAIDDILGLSK